jgi:tetratricopeptide (TPR) repeat protein
LLLGSSITTLVLTYPALSGPLLFDDHSTLGPLLESSANLGTTLDAHLINHSGPTGRPVAMATFIANDWLNGPNLWAWKLTNLLIHLACGGLLFLLTRELARAVKMDGRSSGLLGAAIASLWLLHPLHVSTVFYTVQRMTILAALFVILGMLFYLAARRRHLAGVRGVAWRLIAAAGCGALATLAKESGALLLLYVLVIETVLATSDGRSPREIRWQRNVGWGLALLFVAGASLTLPRLLVIDAGYATRPFTLAERLWTEARVVAEYVGLTLAPRLDAMSFFHDDIVLSEGPLTPPSTLAATALLGGLLASTLALRHRAPLYAIGIGLFFAGHLVESTVIPLHLMYEHRQYFPSFGLLLAVVALFAWLPLRPALRAAVAFAFAGLCALLLAQRATDWSNEWRLYEALLEANPKSPSIAIIVGNSLAEAGEIDAAREILVRFDTPAFELNVAYLDCLDSGRLEPGRLAGIDTPQRFDFHERSLVTGLGSAALDGRCHYDPAEFIALTDHWLEVPAQAPHDQTLRHRAFAYARLGDLTRAVAELERLQARYPQLTDALYLAARWRLDAGDATGAHELAERARAVEQRLGIEPTSLATSVWQGMASAVRP